MSSTRVIYQLTGGDGETRHALNSPGIPRMIVRAQTKNRLLARCSTEDFALLAACLTPVDLPVRKVLQTCGKPIDALYFLESGLASMVITSDSQHKIEIGVVGYEGMTGYSLAMGASQAPWDIFMQSSGTGWMLAAPQFQQLIQRSRTLQAALLLYGHTRMVQMASTVLANGKYSLLERLARWLLMANDRADSDTIQLTHEFLSVMLGVRRAGVTTALNALQKTGLIASRRGSIEIQNRNGLKDIAGGSYGILETELDPVFPAAVVHASAAVPAPVAALL